MLAKQAGKKEKIHELITQQIILENSELNHGLSKADRQEVVSSCEMG